MWFWMTVALAGPTALECPLCPADLGGGEVGFPVGCEDECKSDEDTTIVFEKVPPVAWADLEGTIHVPRSGMRTVLDLTEVTWIVYVDGQITTRPEIEAWLASAPHPSCQ